MFNIHLTTIVEGISVALRGPGVSSLGALFGVARICRDGRVCARLRRRFEKPAGRFA
jgi:hypothetical protein